MRSLFAFFIFSFCPSLAFAQEAKTERVEGQKLIGTDTEKGIQKRRLQETRAETLAYAFRPHKPAYFLPLSYSHRPNAETIPALGHVENFEVKMQFSFKFDIFGEFWKDTSTVMFGYTNLAFWQLYNNRWSAPFRETNHEPEFYYTYTPPGSKDSIEKPYYRVGFVHQSNGLGDLTSRSWNRIYVQSFATLGDVAMSLKVWHRFKDKPKDSPTDLRGDNNPDINFYMGYFEYMASKKFGDDTVTILFRNNLKKDNRGALDASWSFPLNERFKGYFQYFRGHGESMIDYNHDTERFSLGILAADWI